MGWTRKERRDRKVGEKERKRDREREEAEKMESGERQGQIPLFLFYSLSSRTQEH